jgi:hypothetical protein
MAATADSSRSRGVWASARPCDFADRRRCRVRTWQGHDIRLDGVGLRSRPRRLPSAFLVELNSLLFYRLIERVVPPLKRRAPVKAFLVPPWDLRAATTIRRRPCTARRERRSRRSRSAARGGHDDWVRVLDVPALRGLARATVGRGAAARARDAAGAIVRVREGNAAEPRRQSSQ